MNCVYCGTKIHTGDFISTVRQGKIHEACLDYVKDNPNFMPHQGPTPDPPVRGLPVDLQEGRYVIGTVSWKAMAQWYTVSLVNTYRNIRANHFKEPEYFLSGGLYVISSRNILVKQVKQYAEFVPVNGILWIDDDIQWYWEDVVKVFMLSERDPSAIVGCLYPGREGEMIAGKMSREWDRQSDWGPAEHLGFGFTYTPLACFTDDLKPWFFNDWRGDNVVGEDVYFCEQQKAAGRPITGIARSTVKHSHEPGPRGITDGLRNISADMIKFF